MLHFFALGHKHRQRVREREKIRQGEREVQSDMKRKTERGDVEEGRER